jgi:RimJ/RimL family protein N-acetyltransferase
MVSVESLSTERLAGERLRVEDLEALESLHRDPVVMATLGGVWADEQTAVFLHASLDHWERYGFGFWMFQTRSDGLFVGRAGLRHLQIEGRDEVELAYALRPEAWGKGLATEMARRVLKAGFEELGLDNVVSFTLPTNVASRRVMEKAGFEFERNIVHADLPHVLYRIRAAPDPSG